MKPLNYTTEIAARRDAGNTLSQIAHKIEVDRRANPANYRPPKFSDVALWLINGGIESRFKKWLRENQENPYFETLESAFDLFVSNAASSQLLLGPGQVHYQIFALAAGQGALGEDSADRFQDLLNLAYTGGSITAESVQAAIDQHDQQQAQSQLSEALAAAQLAATTTLNQDGTVSAAVDEAIAALEAFEVD